MVYVMRGLVDGRISELDSEVNTSKRSHGFQILEIVDARK